MDVRARLLRSQVERIRRIQELGLGCTAFLDQMSEDKEKSRTLVARHGGETMDARARLLRSQVERIRRIQELGLGCAAFLDQMSEDEEKVVHKLLDTEGRRWMRESDHSDLKLNAFAEFKISKLVRRLARPNVRR